MIDFLNIIIILKLIDKFQEGFQGSKVGGFLVGEGEAFEAGAFGGDAHLFDLFLQTAKVFDSAGDIDHAFFGFDIFSACIDQFEHEGFFVVVAFGEGEDAFAFKDELEATIFTEASAAAVEVRADIADGAVVVIGGRFDEDSDTTGAVAFVGGFDVIGGIGSCGLFDGAFDIVFGHIFGFGFKDGGAQTGIGFRITAAHACGDGNLFDDLGEDSAAFRILYAFSALDIRPLTMSSHEKNPFIEPSAQDGMSWMVVDGDHHLIAAIGQMDQSVAWALRKKAPKKITDPAREAT